MSYNGKPRTVVYLSYDGLSGTSSGQYGCILTSPGNWEITQYDTIYFLDDSGGDLNIVLPDANDLNQGRSMVFTKPRLVKTDNQINITTVSNQLIGGFNTYILKQCNDRSEMISSKYGPGGNSTYMYRRIQETMYPPNILYVSNYTNTTFQDIKTAIDFANILSDETTIHIYPGNYNITQTVTINSAFPIKIEGNGYNQTYIHPSSGLTGKPLFDCYSDADFNKLTIDASGITGYDNTISGGTAIKYNNGCEYSEIKDVGIYNFYNCVEISGTTEIWLFDSEISDSLNNGILSNGGTVTISETSFINNKVSLNILSGTNIDCSVENSVFDIGINQTGISYNTSNVTYDSFYIMSNDFDTTNSSSIAITGFDFTKEKDSNIVIRNNNNIISYIPYYYVKINDNAATTTLSGSSLYYRCRTNSYTYTNVKFGYSGDTNYPVFGYLPSRTGRTCEFYLTGNLQCGTANSTFFINIWKNGVPTAFAPYSGMTGGSSIGEIEVRVPTANQPFPFALLALDTNVIYGDYYQVVVRYGTNGLISTFQLKDLSMIVKEQN